MNKRINKRRWTKTPGVLNSHTEKLNHPLDPFVRCQRACGSTSCVAENVVQRNIAHVHVNPSSYRPGPVHVHAEVL